DINCLPGGAMRDGRQVGSLVRGAGVVARAADGGNGAGRSLPRGVGLALAPGAELPALAVLAAALLGHAAVPLARLLPPLVPGPVPARALSAPARPLADPEGALPGRPAGAHRPLRRPRRLL